MSRTFVIGDVHGCADELHTLLKRCRVTESDRVIFVGDLIGRGPQSRQVLNIVREYRAQSVLGDYEAALLEWKSYVDRDMTPPALDPALFSVSISLVQEDWDFLKTLPLYIRIPEYNSVVVHGGFLPNIPIEEQNRETMLTLKTVESDADGDDTRVKLDLWASAWQGPEVVFFGHNECIGLQRHPKAIGLDTGCVFGGELTTFVLPHKKVFKVEAKQAHAEPREDNLLWVDK
jgi:diadenosine tetraphosphatase ApaH/serine/threonine PP2A family protein phosphatase